MGNSRCLCTCMLKRARIFNLISGELPTWLSLASVILLQQLHQHPHQKRKNHLSPKQRHLKLRGKRQEKPRKEGQKQGEILSLHQNQQKKTLKVKITKKTQSLRFQKDSVI